MAIKRIRACHLLAAKLAATKNKDGFVPRKTLVNVLLRSRYASTAESKISGYMNDIRLYEDGLLEMKQAEHSRLFQAYRLVNREDFDPKSGFNLKRMQELESDVSEAEEQIEAARTEAKAA